jgi:hypothetical protein
MAQGDPAPFNYSFLGTAIPVSITIMVVVAIKTAVFVLMTPPPVLPLLFWPRALEIQIFPMLLLQILMPGAALAFIPFVIVPGIAVIIPVIAVLGCQHNWRGSAGR